MFPLVSGYPCPQCLTQLSLLLVLAMRWSSQKKPNIGTVATHQLSWTATAPMIHGKCKASSEATCKNTTPHPPPKIKTQPTNSWSQSQLMSMLSSPCLMSGRSPTTSQCISSLMWLIQSGYSRGGQSLMREILTYFPTTTFWMMPMSWTQMICYPSNHISGMATGVSIWL